MVRKRKLRLNDSVGSDEVGEVLSEEPEQTTFTVQVEAHTHAGVLYHSGDPIVLNNPASVRKLRAKGIIS